MMREKMSIPADGSIIISNKLGWGDRLLLLYGDNVDPCPVFQSFVNNGLADGNLCLYAFDATSNKLFLGEGGEGPNLRAVPLRKHGPDLLEKFYNNLRTITTRINAGEHNGLRILIDFGKIINSSNSTDIIDCEREILRKTKQSSRMMKKSWSKLGFKRYKNAFKEKFPIIALTAYNITSIDNESIETLIGLHDKIVVSEQNKFIALLPNFTGNREISVKNSLDIISKEAVEEFVKKNLESIILAMLYGKAMCGYDMIKIISMRYHTFVTQGTVYSILYSLEKGGILKKETMPDNKTKVFILTENGRNVAKNKLTEFTKILEYTFSILKLNNQF
ncbi:MAG: PadR family transcriptional regulator [Candidatus Aenigmarchaeota archaeon]|nr:PadR family transcriptional regulator [Candidatus Aenigmarchaeota archaeon]